MALCSICHRITATGGDHLDCTEKRRVELEDLESKGSIPEKLDAAKNSDDLAVEVRAILEQMGRERENS